MAEILLIEDEVNIRKIIAYDLKNAGHTIVECGDGLEAKKVAALQKFDVMIIDWMLPGQSGIDLITQLRNDGSDAIMIMLTARDGEHDILTAFESGVDDYMSKPFSPRELLARIEAHLKRQNKKEEKGIDIGSVHISLRRREVSIQGNKLLMTKKEFDLLEYLARNKGIVLSRDQILNDIWGFDYDGDTRIVDVHIFKLRAKLKPANVEIKSTRGVGYLLEEVE
ncbi:MAG: response regulator transcription factor [Erysipelotrichaceae bacterium]